MRHHRPRLMRLLVMAAVACCTIALAGPVWSTPTASPAVDPATAPVSTAPVHEAKPAKEAKIKPKLVRQLDRRDTVDFWVRFKDRANLGAAKRAAGWSKRGKAVAAALRHTARDSQRAVRGLLRSAGVKQQDFWVTNAIKVTGGSKQLAHRLAARPEVEALYPSFQVETPKLTEGTPVPTVDSVDWGVANINADDVWKKYGDHGEGIVVATIDTGVQFDHPALVNQYRGTKRDGTFDHNYNWFDAAGTCGPVPCDTDGHGTHTMGTIAGWDGGDNHIGVAPGVKWIAANGCCPNDAALVASGQWMLAPTDLNGENPDPSKRPDIVNNSWGTKEPSTRPFLDDISRAWTASGIFGVWANGNSGPACQTSGSPGSLALNYSVGAYGPDGAIAPFSSRGVGEGGEIKPNISAPGVDIRSSVPGDGYDTLSGTSMATPHVAGAVALLWSAAPALARDVEGTRALLDATAVDHADDQCGGTADDNNVYGEGELDVLALMAQAPIGDTGRIGGTVTDATTGDPIPGAFVTIHGPVDRELVTKADGSYLSPVLPVGSYSVRVESYGWVTTETTVEVTDGETTAANIAMPEAEMATVTGVVRDDSGHGWPLYAKLTIDGYPKGAIFTDPATGRYHVSLAQGASYQVHVDPEYGGYQSRTETIQVGNTDLTHDIALDIDPASCSAPGYRWNGSMEGFDGWTGGQAQDGWTVDGAGWRFDNPGRRSSPVGGSGRFAIADSLMQPNKWVRTTLTSPAMDLRGVDDPQLTFDSAYFAAGKKPVAEVQLSLDGGRSWQTRWKRTGQTTAGEVSIALPDAAGQADVRVRFHYQARDGRWWAIDNVFLGNHTCVPAHGGLVVGLTSDEATGAPVFGTITEPSGGLARSLLTPADDDLADGFYALFVPGAGPVPLTVQAPGYTTSTGTVDVAPDDTVARDWALTAEVQ